ncbi:MAG: Fmu (Sun) domain-containing protein [Chitinophagaceae bacterium]
MKHYYSYLNSATAIIAAYKGDEPFTSFLKKYFSLNKKFGSKDRKQVSHLCYCYYRLGKALTDIATEERILIALFFCSYEPNDILQELKPAWNANVALPFYQKQRLIGLAFEVNDIFGWVTETGESLDKEAFVLSHLQQPDLFLRLRPGNEIEVKQKLANSKIEFQVITDTCIALPNSSKIDVVIAIDKEAVIQDYSSQRVREFLSLLKSELKMNVWDCCAASGGKSILANDILGDIKLSVSDIRDSILINLKKRFVVAGIKNFGIFIADLAKPIINKKDTFFDLIIADVPCTGSGTWSRTPEQLYFFKKERIGEYAVLQKKIASNIIPFLKPGGYLLYITCSVFRKENEESVNFLKEKFQLQLLKMELLKGYDKRADTMFAALLRKPL